MFRAWTDIWFVLWIVCLVPLGGSRWARKSSIRAANPPFPEGQIFNLLLKRDA